MNTTLKQIIYDMRHQPVVAWVTLIATAMSIFLIMIVVLIQQVKVVPFAPESCRDRLMVGMYYHERGINGNQQDGSGSIGYDLAERFYSDLDGVERISYSKYETETAEIKTALSGAFDVKMRPVDAEFFNIFDHKLLQGRYFTAEEVNSDLPVAVVSESVARKAIGSEPWEGATITLNLEPFKIVGVVADNSPLAYAAYGDIFVPMQPRNPKYLWGDWGGNYSVDLLIKEGVDFQHITDQVKARYENLRSEIASENLEPVYHDQPYSIPTIATGLRGSNNSPNPENSKRMRMYTFAILLIVPAINLGSMIHSRMRRRVNEFGVRRAFGCTRLRLVRDIIIENFIVTLIGGTIGLLLGIVCGTTYSGLYESYETVGMGATPSLAVIFNWQVIAVAIGVCFILNIISASLPAIVASRSNIVNAINKK